MAELNVYIYDMEVYKYNWLFVARKPGDNEPYTVIWDDNFRLREWLNNVPDIIGGFNNKHYDDYLLKTIIKGGSNTEVKRCNDWIINKEGKPWEFPFISYQKKTFKSFDLRDDIADDNISLKAIEGNLKIPIIECVEVPFDTDRPLTDKEKRIVEKYCKHDVDSTVKLFWERKENYLDAKVLAGEMYGIEKSDALGMTNAKLSATALEAKYKQYDDERDYILPANLPPERIPKIVLDFFMQIRDKSIPDAKLFGAGKGSKGMTLDVMLKSGGGECPVTYAWGGVHGAPPCITIESDDDYLLCMDDVASLYPNSMINFGYTSRSMKDPNAYQKLVQLRITYKGKAKKVNKLISEKLGSKWYNNFTYKDDNGNKWFDYEKAKASTDEETYNQILEYIDCNNKQSSLKLIINTCYGAMLATGNGLNDRLGGRSVCITNQLAMTILISDLCKACESIWFFNINTDGIGYRIHKSELPIADRIIADWSRLTKFEMERTIFKKFIQKDVNNYIGILEDGSFKTKGGYVSLYKGGNFKTNSLQIIHKAIVDYLVYDIPVETSIKACREVTAFQQIIKTGKTFDGSYQYVDGVRVPLQKVNRIYAVKDKKYGKIVKGKQITEKRKKNKETGKMDTVPVDPPIWSETVISECPKHCYSDNENKLTVDNLDLDYYIDMAKRRIDSYLIVDPKIQKKIDKIDKEIVIMATKKEEVNTMNVFAKLNEARKRFLESGIKKNGVNRYAEFKYFTLEDIIPAKQKIFNELGLCDVISFDDELATLTLTNADNPADPNESILFTSQLAQDESLIKNPIQKVGAIQTYVRRYLYMMVLDIIESDAIDAVTDKPVDEDNRPVKVESKPQRPATNVERQETKKELVNAEGEATKTQKTAISKGLKKLRAKYMDDNKKVFDEELEFEYEGYIAYVVKKVKAGISKTEADELLIEIGNKVTE